MHMIRDCIKTTYSLTQSHSRVDKNQKKDWRKAKVIEFNILLLLPLNSSTRRQNVNHADVVTFGKEQKTTRCT